MCLSIKVAATEKNTQVLHKALMRKCFVCQWESEKKARKKDARRHK